MVKVAGIKFKQLDINAIATGLYQLMSEDDKAVMAFGMVPKNWIDLLKDQLGLKYDRILEEQGYDLQGIQDELVKMQDELGIAVQTLRQEFIDTVSSEVVKELYNVADMVV